MKHYIKNIGISNIVYANNIAPGEFYEMYDDSTGVLGIDISIFLAASQSNTGLGKDIYDGNIEYYQDAILSDMLELRDFITYLIGIEGSNITSIVNLINGSVATTQSPGDNSNKIATTAYVDSSLSGYALLSGATFTGIIGLPKDTRRGLSAIYNEATGDVFGMEQVSAAQTGAAAATRIFTSSAGSSTLSLGKYTSATAFTDWLSFAATGNATFLGTVAASNLSGTNTGDQDLSGLQLKLVSGENLKTINSESLLGSGNITITASSTTDNVTITGEGTEAIPFQISEEYQRRINAGI
jgi:hypothetical protein